MITKKYIGRINSIENFPCQCFLYKLDTKSFFQVFIKWTNNKNLQLVKFLLLGFFMLIYKILV